MILGLLRQSLDIGIARGNVTLVGLLNLETLRPKLNVSVGVRIANNLFGHRLKLW